MANRNRFLYFIVIITVMTLGLSARRFSAYLPNLVNTYLGDSLWALMVYFLLGFLFKHSNIKWIALAALLFCFSIETSQLYHSSWIDSLRRTKIGGLVLGYGFLWSDLIAYSIGIGIGAITEKIVFHIKN